MIRKLKLNRESTTFHGIVGPFDNLYIESNRRTVNIHIRRSRPGAKKHKLRNDVMMITRH